MDLVSPRLKVERKRITKIGSDDKTAAILGSVRNPPSFKLRVVSLSGGFEGLAWVGLAPKEGFKVQGGNAHNCGYFLHLTTGRICSQRHVSESKSYSGPVKENSTIEIRFDALKKEISFLVDGTSFGVAFKDVPTSPDLYPAVQVFGEGTSLELA